MTEFKYWENHVLSEGHKPMQFGGSVSQGAKFLKPPSYRLNVKKQIA